jgi:hypothetical protein
MVIHNQRSPRQWEIISSHIDFKDKSVIDLGCGWCDLLNFANKADALACVGVDKEKHFYAVKGVKFIQADLEKWIDFQNHVYSGATYDIALCFSVLPYLENMYSVLEWMYEHADVSFIECQYKDDGPGPDWLKDDNDMLAVLRFHDWDSIKPIGHTLVKGRNKKRTIWMCE